MHKIRLEIDELQVESFETEPQASSGRGTVRGRELTEGPPCTQDDCTHTGCSSNPNPCFCTEIGETCPECA